MFLASVFVLLVGCVTPVIPGASKDLLAFLRVGATTRQEVILTLGEPSVSFEQERILTYRIGQNEERGYYVITPKLMMSEMRLNQPLTWEMVRYSLVLVFDGSGVLEKQKLIPVQ